MDCAVSLSSPSSSEVLNDYFIDQKNQPKLFTGPKEKTRGEDASGKTQSLAQPSLP